MASWRHGYLLAGRKVHTFFSRLLCRSYETCVLGCAKRQKHCKFLKNFSKTETRALKRPFTCWCVRQAEHKQVYRC